MNKLAVSAISVVFLLAGCKKEDASHHAPKTDSAAVSGVESDLVLKPSADQVAKAKRVGNRHCPVSGEKLGGMGAPVPVIYKGELVELCCAGCLKDFENDPAGMLAKAKADAILGE